MFNLTRKGLWAHKVRFVLTGLAVVLGVAFMAGTMILTDTMGKTFDGLFATSNEGIDVVVHRTTGVESDMMDVQERVDASVLDQLRRIDGVDAAAGSIEGFAQIVGADGTAAASNGFSETMGIAWISDDRLNPFELRSGRAPSGPSEIVVDQATVEGEGWALGDAVGVLAKDAATQMTIVGTAGFGTIDGIPGVTVIAADDATAQVMFAQPGAYDAIVLAADDSTTAAGLAERIEAEIGSPDLEILTGDADTADKQAAFKEELLQHLPHGLRLHRALRRDVHHLQHLLDHHRPAHAGDGHAQSRRGQPPPGAALGSARVGHHRGGVVGHRPRCRRADVLRPPGAPHGRRTRDPER
jgi:putative ABC transport system permease protein